MAQRKTKDSAVPIFEGNVIVMNDGNIRFSGKSGYGDASVYLVEGEDNPFKVVATDASGRTMIDITTPDKRDSWRALGRGLGFFPK